jgi:peptidoglycan/xylan/chitin deacetylase (PgdA/CDA1 family)
MTRMSRQPIIDAAGYTWLHDAPIRGPRTERVIALVFTGGDFGEGTGEVLDTLAAARVPGSFYFTGDYLRAPGHQDYLRRMLAEGHVVGPHGDAHLLYCAWEDREKTLVTREEFLADLQRNLDDLLNRGVPPAHCRWWIPPYEWYNAEVAGWARASGHPLFNFSPGTLSHTDYTEDDAPNFRSNEVIWDSIFDFERRMAEGLSGFMLLTHVGTSARRTTKFYRRLGAMIASLGELGYTFTTVPEMLAGVGDPPTG